MKIRIIKEHKGSEEDGGSVESEYKFGTITEVKNAIDELEHVIRSVESLVADDKVIEALAGLRSAVHDHPGPRGDLESAAGHALGQ